MQNVRTVSYSSMSNKMDVALIDILRRLLRHDPWHACSGRLDRTLTSMIHLRWLFDGLIFSQSVTLVLEDPDSVFDTPVQGHTNLPRLGKDFRILDSDLVP